MSTAGEVTGFITKRGKIVHSWKRRFFVLDASGRFLYYGDTSRDILMGGGFAHGVQRWPEKKNGLLLTCHSGRKFQLICDTADDYEKWWKAFSHAVDQRNQIETGMAVSMQKARKGAVPKKSGPDPSNSTFLHLVDEVVGDNGLIEDDAENVPASSLNVSNSFRRPNMLQRCKSLFGEQLEVQGFEGLNKRNRAPSDQDYMRPKKVNLDDFRLVQTVGKGGFGKVLKVQLNALHDADRGKVFAMKILRKQHVVDTRQVNTTKTERRILHKIDHPFVVKLRYAFQSSSKLYMVMDYYSGGSLFYHIERSGVFTEKCVRFFAAEITLALDHLHQHGVIYRDLKLENVLLDGDGHVALTDFGLSKDECDANRLTNTFCGTPVYVAPELVEKNPYGFSIDWWALGVIMYELISGRVPFASRDRRRMFDKIVNCPVEFCSIFSDEAQSIIGDLLVKDPDFRLGSFLNGQGGKDVQQHTFFEEIDFDKLFSKEIVPPFKPPKYVCENNVRGIEARDTHEIGGEDIYKFDNFTLVEEQAPGKGTQGSSVEAGVCNGGHIQI